MADYPEKYPILPVVIPKASVPKSSDRVLPMREIIAICIELGINPRTISDAVAPTSTPASIAAYLDMVANILKALSGGANWYNANVPIRRFIGGSGALNTVGAGATSYIYIFGRGVSATEGDATGMMCYTGVIRNLYVITSTAQPATGTLVFTLRKKLRDTGLILTVAANAAAGIYSAIGSIRVNIGDYISLRAINNASGASAQINGFAFEIDQYG